MSASRDPFPMSSPEAKAMAESVEGDQQTSLSAWGNMNTESEGKGPNARRVASQNTTGRDSLTGKSKRKSKNLDDLYGEVEDDPEEDEGDDDFFDISLKEHRGSPLQRTIYATLRWLKKIYVRLYGEDLPPSEMLRTLCLGMTLFFMIGGYWLLRSLKDPVLTALCGVETIPKAKMVSVFVVLAVVSIYNKFLDSDIPRYKLFYIFGTFYFCLFSVISSLLMHPTIGMPNQREDPWRILGWISYCSIESFGSVMVSLFWSFANSNFSLQTAKASYGVMVATAQIGSILGPTLVSVYSDKIGEPRCYMLGALCMLALQGSMYLYIRVYGAEERNTTGSKKSKPKAGLLEGLKLFWDHNYIKGIFAISCLFMVEVTIVDYTMKVLARNYFASLHPCEIGMSCWDSETLKHGMSADATTGMTKFMGLFGQATNTLSFVLSLLGTSAVIRYLGLRLTLLLFPTLCLCVIIVVRIKPTLYVVFAAMMILKACSYSLNNPTKEMLYQPTSTSVRYKAKSWIDIFGARGSKAMGSVVTNAFSSSAEELVANGSLVGMAVASFLIWNARYMGKLFDQYTKSGYIVGESDTGADHDTVPPEEVQMGTIQNDEDDTSCALPMDDDEVGAEEEGQSDEGVEEAKDDDHDDDDLKKAPVVATV